MAANPRNDRLRAAREAIPSPRVPGACLSRAELAELANTWMARHLKREGALDAQIIARYENGKVRVPNRDYRAALRAVLGVADDAELAFAAASPSHRPLRPRRPSEPVAAAMPAPADDGAPATSDYLDEMRATISHLAALDGVHGGSEVAPIALRSFRRAQRLLGEGRYVPAIERDLEAVTAELGELSGWLLFDAERYEEARAVNAEALSVARIAGDTSMEWFVLSNQALASVHTGRDREALRVSQRLADRDRTPGRVRALFDVRTARALASLGDRDDALRTFDRARSAFADGTTGQDPVWSWWLDERELAGHEGMVHAALGDYDRALPQLAAAVQRSEGREHFRWALFVHRANMLRASLAAGSWSDAERAAIDVAPMVGEVASGRTEGLLRRVVTHPQQRTGLPSTLSDALGHIAARVGAC